MLKKISLLVLCCSLFLSLALAKTTEAATPFKATATITGTEYPIKKQGDIIIFNVAEYLNANPKLNESNKLEKFSFSTEKDIKTISFEYNFDSLEEYLPKPWLEELAKWEQTLQVNGKKAEYHVPTVLGEWENGQDGVSIKVLLDYLYGPGQLSATANISYVDGTNENILLVIINENDAGWKHIAENWFYFNEDGSLKTGWVKDKNIWYFLKTNGAMKTGWVKDKNIWYFLNTDGAMETGWVKDKNIWYFLNTDGAMETGWVKDKNKWYFLDDNGAMKTGWVKDKNKWYFLNTDGAMKTGWVKDKNKWYFLNTDGAMKTGWVLDKNKWYYLYADGSMALNTTISGYKLDKTGAWIQ